jgi:hypothetical protein
MFYVQLLHCTLTQPVQAPASSPGSSFSFQYLYRESSVSRYRALKLWKMSDFKLSFLEEDVEVHQRLVLVITRAGIYLVSCLDVCVYDVRHCTHSIGIAVILC